MFLNFLTFLLLAIETLAALPVAFSSNQTNTLSPILPQDELPFSISIERLDFTLPVGIHSYASAEYEGKWLFLAGRTNGLHGFGPGPDNFPPDKQNRVAYVVDLRKKAVYSRSLDDPTSGLSQSQIEQLSVTSPQSFQTKNTLYISGGYSFNSETEQFLTVDTLTAVDIPEFIQWVIKPLKGDTAAKHIRQTADPLLQVTGGYMDSADGCTTLLIFGQNFSGFYTTASNGDYTQQVRSFKIRDNGKKLSISHKRAFPANPNYRRRDLNVIPIIRCEREAFVALSGVFTLDTGVWTVPVFISSLGNSFMPDPAKESTFKQGMNNYICPTAALYDACTRDMYTILFGGISFGFFQDGVFETDSEIPFINECTTIKIDAKGHFTQYLMNNSYPIIPSTGTNPGNTLLFGAAGQFFSAHVIPNYRNGVFQLGKIREPILLGYIVGGIMSTLPNTNDRSDSAASPYIFKVMLTPNKSI